MMSLQELADAAQMPPAAVSARLDALGIASATDWRGRPTVSIGDAKLLVDDVEARKAAHDTEWQQHLADCQQWMRERNAAVAAVAAGAEKAEAKLRRKVARRGTLRRGDGSLVVAPGELAEARARGGAEAGTKFEATRPPPTFDGRETGNAIRFYTKRPADPADAPTSGPVFVPDAPRAPVEVH